MSRATRILSDGIYFGEGPRWRVGRLWFSDILAHVVKSVSPDGDLRTEFVIDDQPSGLGWMPDGSMLIVSMTKRHVLRRSIHLDRQSGDAGMRADRSRRKGLGSHGHRTTVLRLHAGRQRRAQLFMLTAPPANAIDRAGPPAGKLLVAEVEAPHAGLP